MGEVGGSMIKWRIERDSNNGSLYIFDDDNKKIAKLYNKGTEIKDLITAAPEMREALIESVIEAEKCMEMCYQYWPDEEKVDKWKKIIEKATGLPIEEVLNDD
jgi:hypothetical protein